MSNNHIKVATLLIEEGHIDEAIEVLKTAAQSEKTAKKWPYTKNPNLPGIFVVKGKSDFGLVDVAYIKLHRPYPGKPHHVTYHLSYVRGVGGPSAERYVNTGPYDSFDEAADAGYEAWNKHGRIWIGE